MLDTLTDASSVRIADREDEDDLMAMVQEMHQESALRTGDGQPIPLDVEMVRGELHRAIVPNRNNPDLPAWIGVVGEQGELHASMYLSLETTWYSRHIMLVERWLFVRPAFRKSNIAGALIEFAKKSADVSQAYPLIVGHMTPGREEAKTRLYRRRMGNPIGGYFGYTGREAGAL